MKKKCGRTASRRLLSTAASVVLAMVMSSCSTGDSVGASTTQGPTEPSVGSPVPAPPATTATTSRATAPPTPAAGPGLGGTVTIGVGADLVFPYETIDGVRLPASLNPLRDGSSAPEIARLVVPGVYRLDGTNGELTPWLVEQIPRLGNGGVEIADDGAVTVTYVIRDEAVWEDGTPVTAADLAFTHELISQPPPDFVVDESLREIHDLVEAGSLVPDGKTLRLALNAPDSRYERLFEWVVPAHAGDPATFGADWNEALWLAGGPFRFVSYEPTPDPEREPGRIRLERNPVYWEHDPATGDGLPYLDAIEVLTFTPGAFSGSAATWFTTGSLDALLGSLIPPHERGSLGDAEAGGFELLDEFDALIEVMAFELGDGRFTVNPDSLNEHLDYRRAVLAAIDREAVAAGSGQRSVTSILGTAIDGLDHPAWQQYDNATEVQERLATLGAALDRDFSVDPPHALYISSSGEQTVAIGEAVTAALRSAGFETSADFMGDFFGTQWPQGLTDLYAFRMFAGTGGLGSLAHNMSIFDAAVEGPFAVRWQGLGEEAARYSELMTQAAAELDETVLASLLTEAETILADTAIAYPLALRQHAYRPYWPERIQGIVPNRHQGWDTWNAAWWWSPAR